MSDFIKVNFKNGDVRISAKNLIIVEMIGGVYYASREENFLHNYTAAFKSIFEITLEEYERLCKELGVE